MLRNGKEVIETCAGIGKTCGDTEAVRAAWPLATAAGNSFDEKKPFREQAVRHVWKWKGRLERETRAGE